jgi:hypothetical protein
MTLNSHNNITPLTSIPSHITITKCPPQKYTPSKPRPYLNGKSLSSATQRHGWAPGF